MIVVDEQDVVYCESYCDGSAPNYVAWLVRLDRPIAMVQFACIEDVYVICKVEVRTTHRGYGLGEWFLKWLESNVIMDTLYSLGEYTPEGFSALAGKFPLVRENVLPCAPTYASMSFVSDWDTMSLKS